MLSNRFVCPATMRNAGLHMHADSVSLSVRAREAKMTRLDVMIVKSRVKPPDE